MASIKARKGNPFEKYVVYNINRNLPENYIAKRTDDNTSGIDIIIKDITANRIVKGIECKRHKGFSWNQLVKYYNKTAEAISEKGEEYLPLLIFKANQNPTLLMKKGPTGFMVIPVESFFNKQKWEKIPKGYKEWT